MFPTKKQIHELYSSRTKKIIKAFLLKYIDWNNREVITAKWRGMWNISYRPQKLSDSILCPPIGGEQGFVKLMHLQRLISVCRMLGLIHRWGSKGSSEARDSPKDVLIRLSDQQHAKLFIATEVSVVVLFVSNLGMKVSKQTHGRRDQASGNE